MKGGISIAESNSAAAHLTFHCLGGSAKRLSSQIVCIVVNDSSKLCCEHEVAV